MSREEDPVAGDDFAGFEERDVAYDYFLFVARK